MSSRDLHSNPKLFEPFDPDAVPQVELLTTTQAIEMFGISESWLYDSIWPRGPLHRIERVEASGDRSRYFVYRELATLRGA